MGVVGPKLDPRPKVMGDIDQAKTSNHVKDKAKGETRVWNYRDEKSRPYPPWLGFPKGLPLKQVL